jgi:hypothetical protein
MELGDASGFCLPKSKTASDPVAYETSAAESTHSSGITAPGTTSVVIPNSSADFDLTQDNEKHHIQWLEHDRYRSNGYVSDGQSNTADSTHSLSRMSALEAMYRRRHNRWRNAQFSRSSKRLDLHHQVTTSLKQNIEFIQCLAEGPRTMTIPPESVRSRLEAARTTLQADNEAVDAQRQFITSLTAAREMSDPERDRTSPTSYDISLAAHEHRLPGKLDGRAILAFPDTGTDACTMSLSYARSHGYTIDRTGQQYVLGSHVNTIGTGILPFSFQGEKESYSVEFNVLRNSPHDVVIGGLFLRLTQTLTRYQHRLKQMLRGDCLQTSPALGSHGRVRGRMRDSRITSERSIKGYLNGDEISACPDTGADANFVSLKYAETHGLPIDPTAISSVQLGNGSIINTLGTTSSSFSFAGEETIHTLSFDVLRTSIHDIVLGTPFLKATETMTRFASRIHRRLRNGLSRSYRLCALGSQQRAEMRPISAILNGGPVHWLRNQCSALVGLYQSV